MSTLRAGKGRTCDEATTAMLKDIETADAESREAILEAHLDQIFDTSIDVLKEDEVEIEEETGAAKKKTFKFLTWAKKKTEKMAKSGGESGKKKRQSRASSIPEVGEKSSEKLKG